MRLAYAYRKTWDPEHFNEHTRLPLIHRDPRLLRMLEACHAAGGGKLQELKQDLKVYRDQLDQAATRKAAEELAAQQVQRDANNRENLRRALDALLQSQDNQTRLSNVMLQGQKASTSFLSPHPQPTQTSTQSSFEMPITSTERVQNAVEDSSVRHETDNTGVASAEGDDGVMDQEMEMADVERELYAAAVSLEHPSLGGQEPGDEAAPRTHSPEQRRTSTQFINAVLYSDESDDENWTEEPSASDEEMDHSSPDSGLKFHHHALHHRDASTSSSANKSRSSSSSSTPSRSLKLRGAPIPSQESALWWNSSDSHAQKVHTILRLVKKLPKESRVEILDRCISALEDVTRSGTPCLEPTNLAASRKRKREQSDTGTPDRVMTPSNASVCCLY